MSKTVIIPTTGGNPFKVRINGKEYKYKAGSTQTVPDNVAEIIENDLRLDPKPDREIADKAPATIADVKKAKTEAIRAATELPAGGETGDILVQGSDGAEWLSAGSDGDVLTVDNGAPAWVTPTVADTTPDSTEET